MILLILVIIAGFLALIFAMNANKDKGESPVGSALNGCAITIGIIILIIVLFFLMIIGSH